MRHIREVTVFTNGDSLAPSTWSNIPYFFTAALIARGIRVNRVDISPNVALKVMYRLTAAPALKLLSRESSYAYFRSYFNHVEVRQRIKRAIQRYSRSDLNIFLTFSFSSAGMPGPPTVLFSDWTYSHYIKHFLNKKPDILERECLTREGFHIENADHVFALFPGSADRIKLEHPRANVTYLGNVINCTYQLHDHEKVVSDRMSSRDIVFIGGKKYAEGATSLIRVFEHVRRAHPTATLHVIGLKREDIPSKLSSDVQFHGYLDKGNDRERELYYSLILRSRVFVNTTPKWGAFSAAVEAMHLYTPVITTPYDEFVGTFGPTLNFGHYCGSESDQQLLDAISNVFTTPDYRQWCTNAHDAVAQFTWDAYIGKLLDRVEA